MIIEKQKDILVLKENQLNDTNVLGFIFKYKCKRLLNGYRIILGQLCKAETCA
ncbi:hypothetical protein HMPREF9104_00903 [Lentilactobacillus kisonensis F0435]|uniref:Uncharacterized protein n=1 Tax=Lentilactobacillus kisonensis F0435 TaxID=797516 RepID=H1LE77_9LACO|nr:hypothetical protein HMPREF9104_00903 [Lentilactobacillus kisonensis F0435]